MESCRYLIVGGGVTGLAFANWIGAEADWQIVEANAELGGYCRTIHSPHGFVWDYSGHFFHFRHPEIEQFLRERMKGQEILRVRKSASILYEGGRIDFPFQKNIHQLPLAEFIECLHDLVFAAGSPSDGSFAGMLYGRLGRGITEKFLRPYNEKLYACDLESLDADAMGRFFPHADLREIVKNMRHPDPESYNATFVYPRGGAEQYVGALAHDLRKERIHLREALLGVDVERRVARTNRRELRFEHLISSLPFPKLAAMCAEPFDPNLHTYNKVLVFNLGFDSKGWTQDHWIYVPDRAICFYRVGYYDNIFGDDRMSLYVEIGLTADGAAEPEDWLPRVLADLQKLGMVTSQQLIDWSAVVLDPAYVHVNARSQAEVARVRASLAERGVHSVGRYGAWKYCSIEDNIVEAKELAAALGSA
jgi:protoporphyrinogen oxidase